MPLSCYAYVQSFQPFTSKTTAALCPIVYSVHDSRAVSYTERQPGVSFVMRSIENVCYGRLSP